MVVSTSSKYTFFEPGHSVLNPESRALSTRIGLQIE
jgi:hypothetical protein